MNQVRYYEPFVGPFDPCPPIRVKSYVTPPNLFITFQPPGWPQFPPHEALRAGTLWPALFSPYEPTQRPTAKAVRKERR
ncbi:spore coat associated protein CotJA [Paenibacillus cymbidii]|uniref:spore coat associated protein CotJA n=1 Tax=Paenibacillus cymbidii TaxID=1639034 RepID=UPI001080F7FD|nr:spore coat associated protein CotJA [Paenibacillus cymbidii]